MEETKSNTDAQRQDLITNRFVYYMQVALTLPKQEPQVANLKIGDEATDQGRDLEFGRTEPNTSDYPCQSAMLVSDESK